MEVELRSGWKKNKPRIKSNIADSLSSILRSLLSKTSYLQKWFEIQVPDLSEEEEWWYGDLWRKRKVSHHFQSFSSLYVPSILISLLWSNVFGEGEVSVHIWGIWGVSIKKEINIRIRMNCFVHLPLHSLEAPLIFKS